MIMEVTYQALRVSRADFLTGEIPAETNSWNNEIDAVIRLGNEIIRPRTVIELYDIQSLTKENVAVSGISLDCGKKIARQLRNIEKIAVFVCTVGPGPTEHYKAYMHENELLKAYYADMLGGICVEKAMDIFQDRLKETLLQEGYHMTNRYSPGYCGWSLPEQQKLFRLLPDQPCDIQLTESSLMIPTKSINGIIGIGKEVKYTAHACSLCEMTKCVYRKD